MIEQLPEVQKLSRREKFQLASELWDEVAADMLINDVDPKIVHLLSERYSEYQAGRHPARSWEVIKKDVSKG